MIKQTAGRDSLGDLSPAFAHYNDDILFGENWNDNSVDREGDGFRPRALARIFFQDLQVINCQCLSIAV